MADAITEYRAAGNRPIPIPGDAGPEEIARLNDENQRVAEIWLRRLYYNGEQYEAENAEALAAARYTIDRGLTDLPEHEKMHPYSSHLGEAVDFVADELATGFAVRPIDPEADTTAVDLVAQAFAHNDNLADGPEEILRDALIAGDVVVEVGWDPDAGDDGLPTLRFWESEAVEIRWASADEIESATITEVRFVDKGDGDPVETIVRERYAVRPNAVGEPEAAVEVFWDDDDAPVEVRWLSIPFVPLWPIRARRSTLRSTRGESLIKRQALRHVDRYNANEQTSYLIGRYNSHGNLVVTGDAALLKLERQERVEKDIADVMTFPGGTDVKAVTLPTDPAMIEHQQKELESQLYRTLGLVQLDTESVQRFGPTSGYALEILNRKTEGTFRRIRTSVTRDLLTVANLMLDMTAYGRVRDIVPYWVVNAEGDVSDVIGPGDDGPDTLPDGAEVIVPYWEIEAVDEFTADQRANITITIGSAYIVDDQLIRQDYQAEVISRREALRRKGYSEADIDRIEQELWAETPPGPEGSSPRLGAGSTLSRVP